MAIINIHFLFPYTVDVDLPPNPDPITEPLTEPL